MRQYTPTSIRQAALDNAGEVLACAAPDHAGAFRNALAVLMQDITTHPDPTAAWTYSRLNGNGAPLEFTFSSLDDELRYTVEVGGPDIAPERRLERAGALMARLEAGAFARDAVAEMTALQVGGPLGWGAWLGVRHKPAGTVFKLYAEMPATVTPATKARLDDHFGDGPQVPGRAARLVALGRTLGDDRLEAYYRLDGLGLENSELAAMLAPLGLADRADTLGGLMRSGIFGDAGPRRSLPNVDYGISLSTLPGGKGPVVSVFAFAEDYIGGDGFVRHQMLYTAQERGWDLGAYRALSAPLAAQFRRAAHHNVIAFLVGPDPVAGMHISLSPPAPVIDSAP